jgi:uncharacterized protein YjbI with pentapeptide repeats
VHPGAGLGGHAGPPTAADLMAADLMGADLMRADLMRADLTAPV